MSTRVRSAGGQGSTPIGTERAPVAPATLVVALLIAFCALLLLKWIAVVALVAIGLGALIWWARRDPTAAASVPVLPALPAPTVSPDAEPHDPADDCTWCGLPGGHRDPYGRPLRPRHVHDLR